MIWGKKDVILSTVMDNQVVIISGDTGCGKTTQVCAGIVFYDRFCSIVDFQFDL